MKKSLIMALATIAVVALLVVGGTMAWFTDAKTVTNVFTAGSVSIAINEEFESVTDWVPGDTEDKVVEFKSLGESKTYLRVQLVPTWNGNQANTNITFNLSNSTNWVKSGDWYYYTQVLNKNDVTDVLLESVTISGANTDNTYQGAVLDVVVTAEAVQAENDAYQEAWGLTELPFTVVDPL